MTTTLAPVTPRRTTRRIRPVYYIVLIALAVFSIGPIVLYVFDSLKTNTQFTVDPLGLPSHPVFHNFVTAWTQAGMAVGFGNSAIIVLGTALGVCIIAGTAAYAMTRLDLPGSGAVMVYLLMATSLPIQLFLVPLFYLWTRIHLYNTQLGLIIIYWAIFSPFATFLLRSFMINIPRDYDEAARLDGAREVTILAKVILPLTWPGLLTVALVTGLSAYNEFLLAYTFLTSSGKMPVVISLFQFQQGFTEQYPLMAAAGLIMLLPMLIIFLLLHRKFVAGLAATGLAGR